MKEKSNVYLCDTNTLVRYILGEETKDGKQSAEFYDLVAKGEMKALILESVFTEVIFVLKGVYSVPKQAIAESLIDLVSYKGILNQDKEVYIYALELYSATKLHIVDCILIARAKYLDIQVYSFDKKLLTNLK